MSRVPHKVTTLNYVRARELAGVGLPQEDIAVILDIDPKTLRKYYRDALDDGLADANVAVYKLLLDAIEQGNATAIIFFEKTCGGKRETVQEEIDGRDDSLPCNGKGPCPRRVEDYEPGDEKLGFRGDSDESRACLTRKFG